MTNDDEKVDPMIKLINETIKNGGEVTITLRGKRPEDGASDDDEECEDD